MNSRSRNVAWIDVESGGLSPSTDDLLEVAAIVTGPDFEPLDDGISVTIHPHSLRGHSPTVAARMLERRLNPVVRSMHTTSGLLADIRRGETRSLAEADESIASYLAQHETPGRMIMGGNSITLDRGFLESHAPRTFGALHYRSLDCTSVYELLRRLPGGDAEALQAPPVTGTAHRALDDIRASISQAQHLSSVIRSGSLVDPELMARSVDEETARRLLEALTTRLSVAA